MREAPLPPGAPGGGPPNAGRLLFSMMLTVAELTFVVKMRFKSAETNSICVRFCPVPRIQSTAVFAGS